MSLNFKQETGRLSSSSSLNHILLHPKRFELCSVLHHPLGTISKTNKQIKTNSKNAPNTKKLTKFVLGAITRPVKEFFHYFGGKEKGIQSLWYCCSEHAFGTGVVGWWGCFPPAQTQAATQHEWASPTLGYPKTPTFLHHAMSST